MTTYNLTSPKDVSAILAARGIVPSRAMGQNFLIDKNILDAIVTAAGLTGAERVLEVGPGLGVLTERLAECAAHVTAIEKDDGLFAFLSERWGNDKRLDLIHADALEADIPGILASGTSRVVSNLPYSVGARVVMTAAACANPPELMVLLLQKEVCRRFAALPGEPGETTSSVSIRIQRLYDVEILRDVNPRCFLPHPEVTSSVVRLRRHGRWPLSRDESLYFDGFVKEAFAHRRKQLAAAMRSAGGGYARPADFTRRALSETGAPAAARPEELTVPQWVKLAELWKR